LFVIKTSVSECKVTKLVYVCPSNTTDNAFMTGYNFAFYRFKVNSFVTQAAYQVTVLLMHLQGP